MILTLHSKSEKETREIGRALSKVLKPNSLFLLIGDLGSGKTTLVKGVAEGSGITEPVLSPTFNILKCYFASNPPLYHIDAYRLEHNLDMGLEEFLDGDGATFVEWPNQIQELLPRQVVEIRFQKLNNEEREITFKPIGEKYENFLSSLKEVLHG